MEEEKSFVQLLDEIEYAKPGTVNEDDILPYQYYHRIDLLCGFPWKPEYEISLGGLDDV